MKVLLVSVVLFKHVTVWSRLEDGVCKVAVVVAFITVNETNHNRSRMR